MKLIGIMGNSGSGKTTFSEYLETKPTVGVIHVDLITADIKKRYFRPFLQPKEKNTTENTIINPKVKPGVKSFFHRNKFAFNCLMAVRNKLIGAELNKQIDDFKKAGKRVIVVEDWALPTHKKLFPKFNHIYMLKRDFLGRRRSIEERDGVTSQEAKLYDLPYAQKFIQTPKQSNVTVIHNYGSIEDLYKAAEEEYEKIGELTFDERYSLKGKVNFKDVAIKLGKIKQPGEQTRIDQK